MKAQALLLAACLAAIPCASAMDFLVMADWGGRPNSPFYTGGGLPLLQPHNPRAAAVPSIANVYLPPPPRRDRRGDGHGNPRLSQEVRVLSGRRRQSVPPHAQRAPPLTAGARRCAVRDAHALPARPAPCRTARLLRRGRAQRGLAALQQHVRARFYLAAPPVQGAVASCRRAKGGRDGRLLLAPPARAPPVPRCPPAPCLPSAPLAPTPATPSSRSFRAAIPGLRPRRGLHPCASL